MESHEALLHRFAAMEAELAQLRKEKDDSWHSHQALPTAVSLTPAPEVATTEPRIEPPPSPSPSISSSLQTGPQIACTVCELDLSDDFSDLREHPTLKVALCCDCFDEFGEEEPPEETLLSATKSLAALVTLTSCNFQHEIFAPEKSAKQLKMETNVRQGDLALAPSLSARGALSEDRFAVCVVSKGRPGNVPLVHSLFAGTKSLPTWVVGLGEGEAYLRRGANAVVEGGTLCASRNAALDLARQQGKLCVQMSDDVSEIRLLVQPQGTEWVKPADLSAANVLSREGVERFVVSPVLAARSLELDMRLLGAKLGGAYPTGNEGQAMGSAPVSSDLFCVGDFLVIDPTAPPRFDEGITLKEDYDFTAQHLSVCGVAARSNRTIVKAQHYTNQGGAVADRNDAKEQFNIAVLRFKWPGVFLQHATRGPNEVKMNWRSRSVLIGGSKSTSRPEPPNGYPTAATATTTAAAAAIDGDTTPSIDGGDDDGDEKLEDAECCWCRGATCVDDATTAVTSSSSFFFSSLASSTSALSSDVGGVGGGDGVCGEIDIADTAACTPTPSSAPVSVGMRVEARFQGLYRWYPGTVTAVRYGDDDGAAAAAAAAAAGPLPAGAAGAGAAANAELSGVNINEAVAMIDDEDRQQQQQQEDTASTAVRRPVEAMSVAYDDGDFESDVPCHLVRPLLGSNVNDANAREGNAMLLCCDFCPRVFCKGCVAKACGEDAASELVATLSLERDEDEDDEDSVKEEEGKALEDVPWRCLECVVRLAYNTGDAGGGAVGAATAGVGAGASENEGNASDTVVVPVPSSTSSTSSTTSSLLPSALLSSPTFAPLRLLQLQLQEAFKAREEAASRLLGGDNDVEDNGEVDADRDADLAGAADLGAGGGRGRRLRSEREAALVRQLVRLEEANDEALEALEDEAVARVTQSIETELRQQSSASSSSSSSSFSSSSTSSSSSSSSSSASLSTDHNDRDDVGKALQSAVAHEVAAYVRSWEGRLASLESARAPLQEVLESDFGLDLCGLYRQLDKSAGKHAATGVWKQAARLQRSKQPQTTATLKSEELPQPQEALPVASRASSSSSSSSLQTQGQPMLVTSKKKKRIALVEPAGACPSTGGGAWAAGQRQDKNQDQGQGRDQASRLEFEQGEGQSQVNEGGEGNGEDERESVEAFKARRSAEAALEKSNPTVVWRGQAITARSGASGWEGGGGYEAATPAAAALLGLNSEVEEIADIAGELLDDEEAVQRAQGGGEECGESVSLPSSSSSAVAASSAAAAAMAAAALASSRLRTALAFEEVCGLTEVQRGSIRVLVAGDTDDDDEDFIDDDGVGGGDGVGEKDGKTMKLLHAPHGLLPGSESVHSSSSSRSASSDGGSLFTRVHMMVKKKKRKEATTTALANQKGKQEGEEQAAGVVASPSGGDGATATQKRKKETKKRARPDAASMARVKAAAAISGTTAVLHSGGAPSSPLSPSSSSSRSPLRKKTQAALPSTPQRSNGQGTDGQATNEEASFSSSSSPSSSSPLSPVSKKQKSEKKKEKRERTTAEEGSVVVVEDGDDSEDEDADRDDGTWGQALDDEEDDRVLHEHLSLIEERNNNRKRRKIKRVLRDDELTPSTLRARRLEEDRLKSVLHSLPSALQQLDAEADFELGQHQASQQQQQQQQQGGATTSATTTTTAAVPASQQGSAVVAAAAVGPSLAVDQQGSVRVHPVLSRWLKPHQAQGVRFAWANLVTSLASLSSGSKGLGCVLAHSMGLGKTLTAVALLHTLLKDKHVRQAAEDADETAVTAAVAAVAADSAAAAEAGAGEEVVATPPSTSSASSAFSTSFVLRTALVVCPVNVVANWEHELGVWLPSHELPQEQRLNVVVLDGRNASPAQRFDAIVNQWQQKGRQGRRRKRGGSEEGDSGDSVGNGGGGGEIDGGDSGGDGGGGVLVVGYETLKSILKSAKKQWQHQQQHRGGRVSLATARGVAIYEALVDPGPSVLVADEAHVLKNEKADVTRCLNSIATKRRLALTGTPLQNNLLEYHCMVDFVRERYLGSKAEFSNQFVNPIANGSCKDATKADVNLMRRRSHALHRRLAGFVERRDSAVLQKDLPPKREFVLHVRQSLLQRRLHRACVQALILGKKKSGGGGANDKGQLFAMFQTMLKVWGHPAALQIAAASQAQGHNTTRVSHGTLAEAVEGATELPQTLALLPSTPQLAPPEEPDSSSSSSVSGLEAVVDDVAHEASSRDCEELVEIIGIDDEDDDNSGDGLTKLLWDDYLKPIMDNASALEFATLAPLQTEPAVPSLLPAASVGGDRSSSQSGCGGASGLSSPLPLLSSSTSLSSSSSSSSSSLLSVASSTEHVPSCTPLQQHARAQVVNPLFDPAHSGKVLLLLNLLERAGARGEKVLAFTQSLPTIAYLEQELKLRGCSGALAAAATATATCGANGDDTANTNANDTANTNANDTANGKSEAAGWVNGVDYFVIDGSVSSRERLQRVDAFNAPNSRAKLFLLSSKAGAVGINLVGANHVVLMDSSWNPAVDVQAVSRAFRYGQTKPVSVYRLLAHKSMESTIYKRQVGKLGLFSSIVEDVASGRHFSNAELDDLMRYDDDEDDDEEEEGKGVTEGGGKDHSDGVDDEEKQKEESVVDLRSVLGEVLSRLDSGQARGLLHASSQTSVANAHKQRQVADGSAAGSSASASADGGGGGGSGGSGGLCGGGGSVVAAVVAHEPHMEECLEETLSKKEKELAAWEDSANALPTRKVGVWQEYSANSTALSRAAIVAAPAPAATAAVGDEGGQETARTKVLAWADTRDWSLQFEVPADVKRFDDEVTSAAEAAGLAAHKARQEVMDRLLSEQQQRQQQQQQQRQLLQKQQQKVAQAVKLPSLSREQRQEQQQQSRQKFVAHQRPLFFTQGNGLVDLVLVPKLLDSLGGPAWDLALGVGSNLVEGCSHSQLTRPFGITPLQARLLAIDGASVSSAGDVGRLMAKAKAEGRATVSVLFHRGAVLPPAAPLSNKTKASPPPPPPPPASSSSSSSSSPSTADAAAGVAATETPHAGSADGGVIAAVVESSSSSGGGQVSASLPPPTPPLPPKTLPQESPSSDFYPRYDMAFSTTKLGIHLTKGDLQGELPEISGVDRPDARTLRPWVGDRLASVNGVEVLQLSQPLKLAAELIKQLPRPVTLGFLTAEAWAKVEAAKETDEAEAAVAGVAGAGVAVAAAVAAVAAPKVRKAPVTAAVAAAPAMTAMTATAAGEAAPSSTEAAVAAPASTALLGSGAGVGGSGGGGFAGAAGSSERPRRSRK